MQCRIQWRQMSGCRCGLNNVILFSWCYTWVDVIYISGVVLVLICSNVLIIKLRRDGCVCHITCKYDQYPWPWCKLVPKHKNMINEDNWESWTIEKMRFVFNKWSICFLLDRPLKDIKKSKNVQNILFTPCST